MVERLARTRLSRLLHREALPWIAILACWAIVAATAGLHAAATLIAAQILTRCARDIARCDCGTSMLIAGRQLWRLAAGGGFAAALAGLCKLTSNGQLAYATLILAFGLPTHLLVFAGRKRAGNRAFNLLSTLSVLAAALVAATIGPFTYSSSLTTFALAIVAGQWLAWFVAMALGIRHSPDSQRHAIEPARFAARAQRRTTMRAIKLLLTATFGPFGTAFFRILRSGTGLSRWLSGRTMDARFFLVSGLAAITASIAIFALATGPFLPVVAAALLRLGINALLAFYLLVYISR